MRTTSQKKKVFACLLLCSGILVVYQIYLKTGQEISYLEPTVLKENSYDRKITPSWENGAGKDNVLATATPKSVPSKKEDSESKPVLSESVSKGSVTSLPETDKSQKAESSETKRGDRVVNPETEKRPDKPTVTSKPVNKNIVHRVRKLWDRESIQNLSPDDLNELISWRNSSKLDGLRVGDLVTLTNFHILPNVTCKQRRQLIVLVSSFCTNVQKRTGIRQSWGSFAKSIGIEVVFFLGQCGTIPDDVSVGDIAQSVYVDNYYNLTLKSLSRVRWYNEHCNNTDLVLMCDDDVMVDPRAIIVYYPRIPNLTVVCAKNHYMPIIRDKNGATRKWYVPNWILEGYYYPVYCAGFAYMFNSSVLGPLYTASLNMSYIFVDDAFVSGFVMKELNLQVYNDGRFLLSHKLNDVCEDKSMFASHGYSGKSMVEEWNKRTKRCGYDASEFKVLKK